MIFWKDDWNGNDPSNITLHRLCALELDKQITVALKIQQPGWDTSFRRRLGGGIEEEQWTNFSFLMSSVMLNSSSLYRWI